MKKNIWIWNHYAVNMFFDKGGRHYNFAKYLIEAGYSPTIFCANTLHNSNQVVEIKDGLYKEEITDEIPFVFVKTSLYKGNGLSRIKNMLQFACNVKAVARKITQTSKPDIILASSVHPFTCVVGVQVAKMLGVPCIVEIRDLWPESIIEYHGTSKHNPVIWALYCMEKWMYKKADRLIFTMEGGADYIRDKGWDQSIDMNKIYHINNGVDLEKYDNNAHQNFFTDLDLDNESVFKLVYAGSIRPANNLSPLLDAAKILSKNPNIRFLIWGDGGDKERLQQKVLTEGINNVVFKGKVDKKYVSYILSKSDLNILHYGIHAIQRYGGSQNKLFEYFASGKPVFCDIKMGYDLISKYGAGVTVDSQDPHLMAEAILKMALMPPDGYSKYCANARIAAADYDFKILTDKLIAVIEGVITN